MKHSNLVQSGGEIIQCGEILHINNGRCATFKNLKSMWAKAEDPGH